MRKSLFIILISALPLVSVLGQSQSDYEGPSKGAKSEKKDSKASDKKKEPVFVGYSGGMMVHLGYGMAGKNNGSQDLYGNTMVEGKQKDGVVLGIGGQMRLHFLNHIRAGMEGYFSIMPMHGNSNIRMGWGGGLVDFYTTWKKVRPFVGVGIGGGSISRSYIDDDVRATVKDEDGDDEESMVYNTSFIKTPFFYIDPQLGIEILLTKSFALTIRLDYMLPIGRNKQITRSGTDDLGTALLSPNGPRLYFGFVMNHEKNKKK